MQRKKWIDISIVVVLCLLVFLTAHIVLIDQFRFWRMIYPIQAHITTSTVSCTKNTPLWLVDFVNIAILKYGALRNQVFYIDSQGKYYSCVSGWKNSFLFSKKVAESDRFRYASVSKIITADYILKLVRDHKIKLTDRLVDLLELSGEFQDERVKAITIRDLLMHQSGFDRMRSEDVMFKYNHKPWCPYDLTQLYQQRLDAPPHTKTTYDNRNYCLLGEVIKKVEKEDFRAVIESYYGLEKYNIRFIDQGYLQDEVSYDFRNSLLYNSSYVDRFDFYALSSSAGLSGSAKSLALLTHHLIQQDRPPSLLAGENQKNCHNFSLNSCYGYAFNLYLDDQKKNQPFYTRSGYLPASKSLVAVGKSNSVFVWVGAAEQDLDIKQEGYMAEVLYNLSTASQK